MSITIELGGGGQPIKNRVTSMSDYLNMDAFQMPGVDIVHDVTVSPWPIEDNYVAAIYSCEFMEHISYHKIEGVLQEAFRVLEKGGRFAFECPDFEGIAHYFTNSRPRDPKEVNYMRRGVLGDQSRPFDYHLNILWFDYIKELLEKIGFCRVDRFDCPLDREDYQQLIHSDGFTPSFIKQVKLCVEAFK